MGTVSSLRAVLFDFDGTLTSSSLDYLFLNEQVRLVLANFAPIPTSFSGSALEFVDHICASLPAPVATRARKAALRALEASEVRAAKRDKLLPFTRSMLAALARRGIACAVVTRNCPAAVYTVFPDCGNYCSCILTREDVARVKPNPAHLLQALEQLGCNPCDALMVGDHPMDVQAGRAAGSLTAGVATGSVPLERLAEEKPDWLARDAGELMRTLGLM